MKKISYKIIAAIMSCSIIIAVIIGLLSTSKGSNLIIKEVENNLINLTESRKNYMNEIIQDVQSRVGDIEALVSTTFNTDSFRNDTMYLDNYGRNIEGFIKKSAETSDEAVGAFFFFNPDFTDRAFDICYADRKGKGVFEREAQLGLEKYIPDVQGMEWYYDAIKAGKGIWLQPYMDEEYKIQVVTYSQPVYVNDTLVGVAGIDLGFDNFSNRVNDVKLYDTGYAFMLDKDYNYLVHPTLTQKDNLRTIEKGKYDFMASAMDSKQSGILHINFDRKRKMVGFSDMMNGYVFAVTVPEDEILKDVFVLRIFILVIVAAGACIAFVVALVLGKVISNPVKILTELFNKAKEGDLRVRSKVRTSDEIGVLSQAFNSMLERMQEFITQAGDMSSLVASSSEEVMASSEEISRASEQVAEAVSELAKGASDQAAVTERGSVSIAGIVDGLDSIAVDMHNSDELAEKTRSAVSFGLNSIQLQRTKMEENKQAALNSSRAISELSDKSDEIGEILDVIKTIADQTNLLSLNAAIEAARAGDAGKGFAVVAEEIRKLAEQSAVSVEKIGHIIEEVQVGVEHSVDEMGKSAAAVNEQEKVLQETGKIFEQITNAAEDISESVRMVCEKADLLNNDAIKANEQITTISSIAQETAANTEEISASTEQQTSTFSQIVQSAEELAKLSGELQTDIRWFKV